jgi:hypothetical protein
LAQGAKISTALQVSEDLITYLHWQNFTAFLSANMAVTVAKVVLTLAPWAA